MPRLFARFARNAVAAPGVTPEQLAAAQRAHVDAVLLRLAVLDGSNTTVSEPESLAVLNATGHQLAAADVTYIYRDR